MDNKGLSLAGVIGSAAEVAAAEPGFMEWQVAPYRRGFVFRSGDAGQLRAALLGAATIWGGMRCPILPVDSDGVIAPGWLQLAQAIGPDVIVDFTRESPGYLSAWRDAGTSQWPVIPAQPLTDGRFWGVHPIAAFAPEELADRSLFLPKGTTLLDLASVGRVDLPEEVSWWRDVTYGVTETDNGTELARAQLGGHTVLEATVWRDSDSSRNALMETAALLWLMSDPDDEEEILSCWNTRALRPRGFIRPISIISTPEAVQASDFADDLRAAVSRSVLSRPDLVVASAKLPIETLAEIAESLGFEPRPDQQISETTLGRQPDPDRKLHYLTARDMRPLWGGERTGGISSVIPVALQRPVTRVRDHSPLKWNPALVGAQYLALRMSADAITGPQVNPVARLYHPNASWHHGRLQLITAALPVYDMQLNLPRPDEILVAACSANEVSYEPSDKARHVRGTWALAPHPSMFRRAAILDVIRALTPDSSRELIKVLKERSDLSEDDRQEIKTIAAANRAVLRRLNDICSLQPCQRHPRSAVAGAVRDLVTSGMVLCGLQSDCDVCSVRHLHQMHEATPVPVCPGCGKQGTYTLDPVSGEPALLYRLNTLVQTLALNGGLAPLAATALLIGEGAYVVPGADLKHKGAPAGEVDLLGWRKGTLFAGEAKMSASLMAAADHKADVAKTALTGASEHVAVCYEPITKETRQAIQETCNAAALTMRIVDQPQLFSDLI
jgi:hypothetical protein